MKAVAICASRHAGGSTEHLLEHALLHLKRLGIEGRLLPLLWRKVFPCRDCGACRVSRNGTCLMDEDDFGLLFKAMREADVILVGAPVDSDAAHPDLKNLLERSIIVARSSGNLLSRKIGAPVPIVSEEVSRRTLQRLLAWFPAQDMIVPGSARYPLNKGVPVLAVRADREGLAVMENLAANLAWLAERLKGTT